MIFTDVDICLQSIRKSNEPKKKRAFPFGFSVRGKGPGSNLAECCYYVAERYKMSKGKNVRPLTEPEYLALGEFRYQLRRFLRNMEESTRLLGANPQQYQLVLAIKGLPRDQEPTISHLAERMQLNHNSMVELADRCEEHHLLRRTRSAADRRQVTLSILPDGEALLRKLGVAARQELRETGPGLVEAILRLTGDGRANETKAEPRSRSGGSKKSGP
jgi:DNA-binding MarR family transcriptional regulator